MPSKLLKPQALHASDRIAIIPLASTVKKNILDSGKEYLAAKHIKAKFVLDPVFKGYKFFYSSAAAKTRAAELLKLFKSKDISAIFSLRGGYGSAEMLPLIDFKSIRKNPKIFTGFSDVTAILINLYQRTGLACIHSPSLIVHGFKSMQGNEHAKISLEMLHKLLAGKIINPFQSVKLEPLKKTTKLVNGKLSGGNLTMLNSLLGTEWAPEFDNHIVFIEETGEAPFRVHRMLQQMKQAGRFKKVRALLLGDFIDNRKDVNPEEPTYDDVILDVFKKDKFPIYKGLPVGHGDLNLPVPIGVNAELNQNRLDIKEQAVII